MGVLETLEIVLFLAFLVETMVEFLFGRIADHIPAIVPYKWALSYIAVGVGVFASFLYGFDLVHLISVWLGEEIRVTAFGIVLTGIGIGMGSSYIHQLISQYFPKK